MSVRERDTGTEEGKDSPFPTSRRVRQPQPTQRGRKVRTTSYHLTTPNEASASILPQSSPQESQNPFSRLPAPLCLPHRSCPFKAGCRARTAAHLTNHPGSHYVSTITCILRLAGLVAGMLPSVMLRKGLYPKPPDNMRLIC